MAKKKFRETAQSNDISNCDNHCRNQVELALQSGESCEFYYDLIFNSKRKWQETVEKNFINDNYD